MDHLNLISLLGIFVMLTLAWSMSSHRTKVNWRLVVLGVLLQLGLAATLFQSQSWTFSRRFASLDDANQAVESGSFPARSVKVFVDQKNDAYRREFEASLESGTIAKEDFDLTLAVPAGEVTIARYPNGVLFSAVDTFFRSLLSFVEQGSGFVFDLHLGKDDPTNPKALLSSFAFGVLPTVVFFAALMSILYHLGLMQIVIRAMAWVMQKTLGTTGPESLAAAANVLVGHTEAPLVVKPYVAGMTRSELNALMVGGFSTITGSLMAIFVAKGISAGHLLSASIISAPAALVIAKILQPELEPTPNLQEVNSDLQQPATNVIEAAAIGASDGMKLAINIAAMLIAFLALIALADALLAGAGNLIQWLILLTSEKVVEIDWSLNRLFGAVFYPLAWVMGIQSADCAIAGELLGKKMVVNEFVAYLGLAEVDAGTGTRVVGDVKETITISERTKVILTYALCGFSNFGAIGIQIGGIGPLAPHRRSDLAQLGLRAMFGGMLACCMTACMAGMLFGVLK